MHCLLKNHIKHIKDISFQEIKKFGLKRLSFASAICFTVLSIVITSINIISKKSSLAEAKNTYRKFVDEAIEAESSIIDAMNEASEQLNKDTNNNFMVVRIDNKDLAKSSFSDRKIHSIGNSDCLASFIFVTNSELEKLESEVCYVHYVDTKLNTCDENCLLNVKNKPNFIGELSREKIAENKFRDLFPIDDSATVIAVNEKFLPSHCKAGHFIYDRREKFAILADKENSMKYVAHKLKYMHCETYGLRYMDDGGSKISDFLKENNDFFIVRHNDISNISNFACIGSRLSANGKIVPIPGTTHYAVASDVIEELMEKSTSDKSIKNLYAIDQKFLYQVKIAIDKSLPLISIANKAGKNKLVLPVYLTDDEVKNVKEELKKKTTPITTNEEEFDAIKESWVNQLFTKIEDSSNMLSTCK